MPRQLFVVFLICCFLMASLFSLKSYALSASSSQMPRRNILFGGTVAAAGLAGSTTPRTSVGESTMPKTASLTEAVQWIDHFCDRKFLHAVVSSNYRFLYRGEEPALGIRTLHPVPDLLDIDTYGSLTALEHFRKLEYLMRNEAVRPSNGHLATTSVWDAALWGEAYSIWPRQDSDFAWFQDGGPFYPRELSLDTLLINGKDCGQEALQDVLQERNAEAMFSSSEYLVVPVKSDKKLRIRLHHSFLL